MNDVFVRFDEQPFGEGTVSRDFSPGEQVQIRAPVTDKNYPVYLTLDGKRVESPGTVGASNPYLSFRIPEQAEPGQVLEVGLGQGPESNVWNLRTEVQAWTPDDPPLNQTAGDPAYENAHENGPNAGPSPSDIATSTPGLVPADNDEGIALAPSLRRAGADLGPEGATVTLPDGDTVDVGGIEESDEVARYLDGEQAGDVVEADQGAVDDPTSSGGWGLIGGALAAVVLLVAGGAALIGGD